MASRVAYLRRPSFNKQLPIAGASLRSSFCIHFASHTESVDLQCSQQTSIRTEREYVHVLTNSLSRFPLLLAIPALALGSGGLLAARARLRLPMTPRWARRSKAASPATVPSAPSPSRSSRQRRRSHPQRHRQQRGRPLAGRSRRRPGSRHQDRRQQPHRSGSGSASPPRHAATSRTTRPVASRSPPPQPEDESPHLIVRTRHQSTSRTSGAVARRHPRRCQ